VGFRQLASGSRRHERKRDWGGPNSLRKKNPETPLGEDKGKGRGGGRIKPSQNNEKERLLTNGGKEKATPERKDQRFHPKNAAKKKGGKDRKDSQNDIKTMRGGDGRDGPGGSIQSKKETSENASQ